MKKILLVTLVLILSPLVTKAQQTNSVDLLWQAFNYQPPFYQGHSLPTSGNLIRVVAWPNIYTAQGKLVPVSQLMFEWNKDDQRIGSASGLGRNVIDFIADNIGHQNILEVTVKDSASRELASNRLVFDIVNPEVVFYEDSPSVGIKYEQALGQESRLLGNELSLVAEPYFFDSRILTLPNLDFSWRVNGQKVAPDSTDKRRVILLAPDNGRIDENLVNLVVKNLGNIFQEAKATVKILPSTNSNSDF